MREDGLVQRDTGTTFDPTRGLFEVFVVDPEAGEIVTRELIVADSANNARLKVLRKSDVDPDDVDIIVVQYGAVREKVKPQRVKLIKE